MPSFGHDMSMAGVPKVEGYSDAEAWNWPQQSNSHHPSYANVFDPSTYANFTPQMPPSSRGPPRHQSHTASHNLTTGTDTPPPARPQIAATLVKAQPAFKPTWRGFLDTTKDAMTVVEASLQGRLNHISRRPHDKERAEMLTSGTVLVYEENASGIKRWTDAVHWSPSRVMNNCLIYRQLVRALKPEEKKTALNPSCGTKRKRKESAGPGVTKTGETITNSDDEYDDPLLDGSPDGDADSLNKVYANFAQSLTPDQQRRFCGSLIDSYEFKEGGLMKKTISVKYQGTHHHVISYYSLEDLVSGKLKRPFQDPKLADIQPRPELLHGWKVSLEDEESKDMPLVAGYPQHIQPSHSQHHAVGSVTQAVPGHAVIQTSAPLHLHVPDYWHGPQASQYTPNHHSPQHYVSPQSADPQYSTPQPGHQYQPQQPSQTYAPQLPPTQQYVPPLSPQHYTSSQSSSPQYPAPSAPSQQYTTQSQGPRHYSFDQPQNSAAPPYAQQVPAPQYPLPHRHQAPQAAQYNLPQAATFDVQVPVPQSSPSIQHHSQASAPQQDPQRRASAPVALLNYSQPQYPAAPYPQSYYVTDAKYMPEAKHTPDSNHGY
ncbi:Nn.00g069320.m01.CDS01 [Neocucurbitaria sp. VM-36]